MVALFNCSQADFILVVNTGLNSYFEYLDDFTAFSPKYTALWGETLRTDLNIAESMPSDFTRSADSEALRVLLVEQASTARKFWQRLKRYITAAFPESLVDIKLMSAGQNLYLKASNENWPSTQMMLSSAAKFIETNLATLTANDNMPPTFPAEFDDVIAEFRLRLYNYEDSKESIMVETQNRIAALNDIHKRFMPMMLDGQEIFSDNEAVIKQFIFTDVLSRVGGTGLAGFNGKVTDNATNLPIPNAQIKVFAPDNPEVEHTASTNSNGDYIVNCPSGIYTVTATAVGYNVHTMPDMVVEVGTNSKLNVKLLAEVVGG